MERNRYTEAIEAARARGARLLDLTASNPTRVGLRYDSAAILDSLRSERALDYDPQAKGLLAARQAVAEYYRGLHERFPRVKEDFAEIEKRNVLVDGDAEGYLLQIFTKNLVGPIFIEMIQRENHLSFGEGNFSALFRSIERDQERRGVL